VYFIRPNTLLLFIFLFCIFLLYHADTQVEVQIRILLKDKYRKLCQKCEHRQSHFDFLNNAYWVFILEQHQDIFLVMSKLSITVYLFLVLYRSTSLKSLSFLKNIKTFLCKLKLVNNHSIPSMQQPYNHDNF
jgi:hypothetical protein